MTQGSGFNARAWLAGLRGVIRHPALPDTPAPSPPAAQDGLVPFARDGQPPRPVLFAAVQGLGVPELETVVSALQQPATLAEVHPLFLTDCPELMLFRSRRALVEYLPAPADLARLAPADEVEIYLARRLLLLCRKWRPRRVVPYGDAAAAWLVARLRRPEAEELAPLVAVEAEALTSASP